jgi:hypothetical protein
VTVIAAIGASLFLLGAAFFLWVAIDSGWIGPVGRFVLGLLVGGILTCLATRLSLQGSYKLGTAILVAGLGVLVFTLRVGAFNYDFYSPTLGIIGAAVTTIFAGALAGRVRYSLILIIALVLGFLSPILFSAGGHHEVTLSIYLAALTIAALAVPYLAKVGAKWSVARWLLIIGNFALLTYAAVEVRASNSLSMLALLALHYALAGVWIWLPRVAQSPSTPTLLWFLVTLPTTCLAWVLWDNLSWMNELFVAPVLIIAFANLMLVKPLRLRLGSRKADLGLLVLATGHVVLAVPVALDWKWVGPLWGIFAMGLAAAVRYAREKKLWDADELRALRILAFGMALVATTRWCVYTISLVSLSSVSLALVNRYFLEGIFTALAWLLLARDTGVLRVGGLLGLEIVGTFTLGFEAAHLARWLGISNFGGSVILTLVIAVVGAGQWLHSVIQLESPLRRTVSIAGYCWLGLASFKLIVYDLSASSLSLENSIIWRALAFLGVGGVFMTAALIAHWARGQKKGAETRGKL